MKKIVFIMILAVSFTVVSCGKAKEAVDKTVEETTDAVDKTTDKVKEGIDAVEKEAEKVVDDVVGNDKVAKGKELFISKTCTSCHAIDKKGIGPSVKEIAKVYAEKKGNLVQFLKGKKDAIVDTDPAQVAVMKANIEGVLKDVNAEDLQAIAAYMRSVK